MTNEDLQRQNHPRLVNDALAKMVVPDFFRLLKKKS